MSKERLNKKNFIGKKKVNRYTEDQCDKVLLRLADHKQDNSIYAMHVEGRRKDLVAKNIAKAAARS